MKQFLPDTSSGGPALAGPLACLTLLTASWAFLLAGAGLGMSSMSTFRFPPPMPVDVRIDAWTQGYAVTIFAMWWIMMIAMMLPGVAGNRVWTGLPATGRSSAAHSTSSTLSIRFCLAYSLAWLLFSLFATTLHYALEQQGLLHGRMMWSLSTPLSAGLLVCVGLYQLSALKRRAAQRCHLLDATGPSLRAGLDSGLACIVSTGPLMLLLFVGGAMNLVWIIALTLVNWLEKRLPNPRPLSLAVGFVCLIGAACLFTRA